MPPIQNILIVRLSAIGDVVHVMPCLHALREAYQKARIGWVVEELSATLLKGHPEIDELYVIPKKRWRAHPIATLLSGEKSRFYEHLCETKWDVAIDFQGLTKSAWPAWRSGAPLRIGFGGEDGREFSKFFTTRRVTPQPEARHVIERNMSLLEPLGIPGAEIVWRFPDFAEERRELSPFLETLGASKIPSRNHPVGASASGKRGLAQSDGYDLSPPTTPIPRPTVPVTAFRGTLAQPESAMLHSASRRFVALYPGAGWETKRWPAVHFAALAKVLCESPPNGIRHPLVLVWGPGEESLCREIQSQAGLPPEDLVLAPRTNLRQLAALLGQAALVIGGDTGPIHIAAALGTPVVGIYGASDPVRNGPWGERNVVVQAEDPACRTCWKTKCDKSGGIECLTAITPERVAEAAREVIVNRGS